MGARGPIPKPADRRLGHRSQAELSTVTRLAGAAVVDVPEPDEAWHPMAVAWFESLAASGQSAFYQPSDWQMAVVAAEVLSRLLASPQRISSQLLASWLSLASSLLTTEGDRRRMRIELQRASGVDEDAERAEQYVRELQRTLSLSDRKTRLIANDQGA